MSDPNFTHWVVVKDRIIGEAHSVEPGDDEQCFAFVRLFGMPENAEFCYIESSKVRPKRSIPDDTMGRSVLLREFRYTLEGR